MLNRRDRRRYDQSGSGTAIGVAIVFPMLMLVIVSLQMLTDAARIEQAIQASANQAARAAALCCANTGGPNGAETVAKASIAAAADANRFNRIRCANDVDGDSTVVFRDTGNNYVPNLETMAVPTGGTVHVIVTCQIMPEDMAGFGLLGLNIHRTTVGVASIDPFRHRPA